MDVIKNILGKKIKKDCKSKNLRLERVRYGKKGTSKKDREYQVNGTGPVGTIAEFRTVFPHLDLEIFDPIK